jgi:hypothetical protein
MPPSSCILAPIRARVAKRSQRSHRSRFEYRGERIASGQLSLYRHVALSPDGRFVFAADYGGENIGYGTQLNQGYVHRLDLADGSWETKQSPVAGNVQATSGASFVLKSNDQWVTFTNNAWGTGTAVTPLDTNSKAGGSGYYARVFFGDFRYDPRTARLLHGNSNLSSQEIQAFLIINDDFELAEGTGIYGSASGYGETVALATDGTAFYYGRLSVDTLDVTHTLRPSVALLWSGAGLGWVAAGLAVPAALIWMLHGSTFGP